MIFLCLLATKLIMFLNCLYTCCSRYLREPSEILFLLSFGPSVHCLCSVSTVCGSLWDLISCTKAIITVIQNWNWKSYLALFSLIDEISFGLSRAWNYFLFSGNWRVVHAAVERKGKTVIYYERDTMCIVYVFICTLTLINCIAAEVADQNDKTQKKY